MPIVEDRFEMLCRLPLLGWLLRCRFVKFGAVGASGVVVNLALLYAGQEYLFVFLDSAGMRLNASLTLAIFFSTVNNFSWNRAWTWADRRLSHDKPVVLQFFQYALACWVGIVLQVAVTKLLVAFGLYYMIANLTAIVLASAFNFVVNDLWTFSRLKLQKLRSQERPSDFPGKDARVDKPL
ncbi:MAG: GtrA family protein [Syntrophobacteraceae bacterium]|nr:GtrA family protein [Desulfobacteraceae bacterium]